MGTQAKTTDDVKAAAALAAATRLNNKEVERKEKVRTKLADKYMAEKKVEVIGAPMYQAFFGRSMHISLNGIPIFVPLDGNRWEIPESYACEFNRRIREINDDLALQKKRNNVQANLEAYPGQLDLVRRV